MSATPHTPVTPFLRWAGGKRTLKNLIIDSFPEDFDPQTNRYFEPFIGGGAVMLATENFIPGNQVVINDFNRELIVTYRAIQANVEQVISDLQPYLTKNSRLDYNTVRASHLTLTDAEIPAWFIFMNKTSFNGIWRVNSTGQYNVPWGQLKSPNICDKDTLRAVSRRIQGATILHGSYGDAISAAVAGDVIYFDPPYLPLTATSFTKYTKEDFGLPAQRGLAEVITDLTFRGVRVIMSNSYSEIPDPANKTVGLTDSIFGPILDLRQVMVARSVGAAAHTRMKAKETLGFNYSLLASSSAAKLPTKQCPPIQLRYTGV